MTSSSYLGIFGKKVQTLTEEIIKANLGFIFSSDAHNFKGRRYLMKEAFEKLEKEERLEVKPGCTGLWQVSERNNVGFHEMVELDIEYIDNANMWIDIQILLKTIWIMIVPNNAY